MLSYKNKCSLAEFSLKDATAELAFWVDGCNVRTSQPGWLILTGLSLMHQYNAENSSDSLPR